MSSLMIGAGIGIVGLLIMLTGIPIAFALGIVAVGAMLLFLDVFQFNMLAILYTVPSRILLFLLSRYLFLWELYFLALKQVQICLKLPNGGLVGFLAG